MYTPIGSITEAQLALARNLVEPVSDTSADPASFHVEYVGAN